MTSATDALGNQTTYGYDASGNQTSVTDPLGRVTTKTFDAQGRVLSVTDPLNGTTSYAYDAMGNQTSITDPVGNTTTFAYDQSGRLTSTTDPLGHATTYSYNQANQLVSKTDGNGQTTDYLYNSAGQQTNEEWLNSQQQVIYNATYTYDAAGELTGASDPYSSYTYTYDAAGRMTSVDNAGTPGVPTVTLSYGYDVYGNPTSLTDSLGGSISYTYNADNQMTSLGLSLSSTLDAQVTFAYDAASRLTGMTRTAPSVSGDTITTSYSYDNADRLLNITHTDTTQSVTLASYTYGYDKASQLTSYQDANSSLTYGYDKTGQLLSASGTLNGSNYSVSYTYDLNGNRTMTGYVTGKGNELLSDGTYNYTYDNNGNTLTQTNISTGSVTYYSWDYRNRLTEVKQETSTGTVINDETFTYDVFNNRIGVSLNGTQQLYTVYDGANPYMDFNGSGQLLQRYLTNPQGLSQFYGQVNASGTTQWFLTDNLGSIRQVIISSGTSLDAITYDPYGDILNQTNVANAPRMMFAGGAYDVLTGNDQFDARPYYPADGRWLRQDPLGFAAGDTNLYRYVFNQPSDATDPTGLQGPIPPAGAAGLGAQTVGTGFILINEYAAKQAALASEAGHRNGQEWYTGVTQHISAGLFSTIDHPVYAKIVGGKLYVGAAAWKTVVIPNSQCRWAKPEYFRTYRTLVTVWVPAVKDQ
jgi:RHS repeat-associated protein